MSRDIDIIPDGTIIYNRFVRSRNVLVSDVDCSALFEKLDQHQERFGIAVPDEIAPLFRNLLAAFTLHCASRPINELMAWTIRYAQPHVSFFLVGDTELGSVAGRFFLQNVKEADLGEMHQELHRRGKEPHTSMVEFSGSTAQSAVHQFYNVSEQRPGRFFELGDNRFALVSAHPDYDEGWFTNIDLQIVKSLEQEEELNLLEKRSYYWLCGCSEEKIMEMLVPIMKKQPEGIFGEDSTAVVNCPRCNASYKISRQKLQELADNSDA